MRQPITKNFSYVLVGKTITNSLQAIFYLAIASILEPEGYGQLIYLISIAGVFTVIFRFFTNLQLYLTKYKNIRIRNFFKRYLILPADHNFRLYTYPITGYLRKEMAIKIENLAINTNGNATGITIQNFDRALLSLFFRWEISRVYRLLL